MINCPQCGNQLDDRAVQCPKCKASINNQSYQQPPQQAYQPQQQQPQQQTYQPQQQQPQQQTYQQPQQNYQQPNYQQPNIIINNVNSNTNNGGYGGVKPKNKWVSLLLCIFLGVFGAHKFYEGRILLGVVYLFTLGLFGIGTFIDFIVLLFKPNPYF